MLYCSSCNEVINNRYYKYLWINNKKTNITVCQACYVMRYMLKPWQFKLDHPKIYKNIGLKSLESLDKK